MAQQNPRKPRKILLLTNVDRGEANVFLATSFALIQADPDVEVHFASFSGLEEAVSSVCQHARHAVPRANPIIFHEIKGLTMAEALKQHFSRTQIPCQNDGLPDSFLASPGFSNTVRAIRDTVPIFVPYSGPQLVEIFSSIVEIIKNVDADLVVVDSLMTPALTVCYHLDVKFACLSPNALKEFALSTQPRTPGRWRYPALFSGFSYPVPWYLIPLNIYFILATISAWRKDSHRHEVENYLASHTGATLKTPVDLLRNRPAGLKILPSSLPELDFPVVVPDDVVPCGPIIGIAPPISEADPELDKWLCRAPTIYVNMGSICRLSEDRASDLAEALKTILETVKQQSDTGQLQVLWKLKKNGEYEAQEPGCRIHDILGKEIQADLVRIVGWIEAEPIAILYSGQIVCSIHHGGANSFNEAVSAGVPQVVLPQWTDCYDYAERVEMLGIGRLGNRKTKPQWSVQEVSHVLADVLQGENSDAIKQKATELADLCRNRGSGAVTAARILLAECDSNV